MAKRSRFSDYKIKHIPSGKARLLFKLLFSYEGGKEGVNGPFYLFQGSVHLDHSHSS